MAIHEFTAHHQDAPEEMYVYCRVDDDGNWYAKFASNFGNGSYFNYSWIVHVNGKEVINIGENIIGSDAAFVREADGTIDSTHFTCIAYCGCPNCPNEAPAGLKVADIDLYKAPTWNDCRVTNRTTKSITVHASWNDSQNNSDGGYHDANAHIVLCDTASSISDEAQIAEGEIGGAVGDPSGSYTFDNLKQDTQFVIKAYISDDKSTIWWNPSVGGPTGDIRGDDAKTRKLSVYNTAVSSTQGNAETTWRCYIDDVANTTGISYKSYLCYLSSDPDKTPVGISTSSSSASPNRTVTTTRLKPYTNYTIVYQITDGYNVKSSTVKVMTLFPFVRIYSDGAWHKAIPYVYNDGAWHMAMVYIYDNDGFKELNGE